MEELEKTKKKNIKDNLSLIKLCQAQISYKAGNIEYAYYEFEDVTFNFQTKEQLSKINDFKKELKSAYSKHIAEETKKEQEKYRKK